MRLTADLLQHAVTYLNTVHEIEIDLRGHKAPAIENLGVTRDQNESIDLTDNDIRHLGNFPRFPRLKTLLLGNNRISTISPSLASTIPNLHALVLTNNALRELMDLSPLISLKRLELLTLLGNPVARHDNYRAWLIWTIPSLRYIDFKKVKQVEHEKTKAQFGTMEDPTPLAAQILGVKSKTFEVAGDSQLGRITEEEKLRIKTAIMNATSMAEVQRLEAMLAEGRVPDA